MGWREIGSWEGRGLMKVFYNLTYKFGVAFQYAFIFFEFFFTRQYIMSM